MLMPPVTSLIAETGKLPATRDPATYSLGAAVGELAAIPLDRSRPLWEMCLISGLSDGSQALYTKVHHAVIDGVSGAEVMAALLDVVATPVPMSPPDTPISLGRAPGIVEMLGRGAVNAALTPVRLAQSTVRVLPTVRGMIGAVLRPGENMAARTPFNAPISGQRAFAYTSLPLDDVKDVKNAVAGTVNDVVMALCTTALRRWLMEHDVPVDRAIVAGVPVSVRTAATRWYTTPSLHR